MEKIKTIETKMAEHFDTDKLTLKVVEECMELCEVLVKSVTKAEGFKPPIKKISEEMGDVLFRMKILARKLHIEKDVDDRYAEKARQISDWYSNKFEN